MGKKGRNKKFGMKKEAEIERGFIVVLSDSGRRVYPGHSEGVSQTEAQRLSDGLFADTKVVPFDHVG